MKDFNLIQSAFENVILTVNSNLIIIVENYTVYDVYNPSTLHGGQLITTSFRHWQLETRKFEKYTKFQHLYWIRRNMTGIVFQTMVVVRKMLCF